MWDLFLRYRSPFLVLLLIIQPLVLILGGRSAEYPQTGVFGDAVLRAISDTQNLAYQGLGGVSQLWDRYLRLVRVNEENERLRREIARLQEERVRLLGVMQENARLRALVGFQVSSPSLQLLAAHVIAKDITPYFRVIRLRLDLGEGIVRPDMPVVAPSGLVGQVSTVMGDYCDVRLTVDPASAIDVLIQRNRARGVLRGNGHENDYTARIAYLLQRDQVEPGDVVVTSGMAGEMPQELVVGTIIEVLQAEPGLFQEVVVRPAVDFSRLEEVFVITGQEGS
ncbi:MAG: rod shape-determining protein MreC [Bradymonadales bacterium]|nr:rod shape-determining protein MreC [Bradymonadales bacterium]